MAQRTPSGLLSAVQRGQKHEVNRLIKRKVSVSEADTDGFTCVMEAAANNHISILSILIEAKADVNAVNRIGRTALIEAAARGHPAITLRLCQARPQIDYVNTQHPLHMTALMEAASRGHDGVTFWLCEARADINKTNRWGDTPLILAAGNNRLRTVQTLVAQRADITIKGDGGMTALDVARTQGHLRIVDFLTDPRITESSFCNELYSKLKSYQKDVLQEEVNYDASTSSRILRQPGQCPTSEPIFEHTLIPISMIEAHARASASISPSGGNASDTDKDDINNRITNVLRLSTASASTENSAITGGSDQNIANGSGLPYSSSSPALSVASFSSMSSSSSTVSSVSGLSTLSSAPSLIQTHTSVARSVVGSHGALTSIPRFGKCTWIAIEPSRISKYVMRFPSILLLVLSCTSMITLPLTTILLYSASYSEIHIQPTVTSYPTLMSTFLRLSLYHD